MNWHLRRTANSTKKNSQQNIDLDYRIAHRELKSELKRLQLQQKINQQMTQILERRLAQVNNNDV